MPRLEALATATPDHRVEQKTLQAMARSLLEAHAPELLDVVSVFESAGIEQRFLARPLDWYLSSPGWAQRSQAYEQAGVDLAERVARECLEQADVPGQAVDGIVFVNTTGLATPSLETHLCTRLGLGPDAIRVPVWGLGCAGGVAGLGRTGDLARAHPEGRFLLVSLELCSLAFLREELSKKMVVASALFGDGAAAALLTGDQLATQGPRLAGQVSHLWDNTRDVMGWEITDAGLEVVFSPEIPGIVEAHLAEVLHPFLKTNATTLADVRACMHPGGPKVLAAYEQALDLDPEALGGSRAVLAEHGNMSSPTALFVLERSLRQAPLDEGEEALVGAVGPGFAAELALLRGA